MNLIQIFSLNKHGDYQEVLFSSILSYLMNPKNDHGLGSIFLRKIVTQVFSNVSEDELKNAKVTPERNLGKAGNVDILIELEERILAIEVKIWDSSAKSTTEVPQLIRYCTALTEEFGDKLWHVFYLIPNQYSKVCLDEFKKALEVFPNKLSLITWNALDPESDTENFIPKSISEVIEEVYQDIPKTSIQLNTQWILDSLYEMLPALLSEIKEEKRFPSKNELMTLPIWAYLEPFFKACGRWPNPLHTTVGVPYGRGGEKSTFHNNCLYRIRTTKDYYPDLESKPSQFPDCVELELWPDVYAKASGLIEEWLKNNQIELNIGDHVHLDGKKTEPVKIIRITKPITVEQVNEFNQLLRVAFMSAKSS